MPRSSIQDVRTAVQKRDIDAFVSAHSTRPGPAANRARISSFVDALVLHSLAHPDQTDADLAYLAAVAHKLTPLVAAAAEEQIPGAEDWAQEQQAKNGGRALVLALLTRLEDAVKALAKTDVTPQPEDMDALTPNYWHLAAVHGLLVARFSALVFGSGSGSGSDNLASIATQADKDRLWDNVVSLLLGRTIFSHASWPPPGALVAVQAFLLGASGTLRSTMKPQGTRVGKGAEWTWYSSEYGKPDQTWTFDDVVRAVEQGLDGQYVDRFKLPGGLVSGFLDLAGSLSESAADTDTDTDTDAATIYSKHFRWIADQSPNGTEAGTCIERAGILSGVGTALASSLTGAHEDAQRGYPARTTPRTADQLRAQIAALAQFGETHEVPIHADPAHKERIEAELASS